MATTLTCALIHFIFSTKGRAALITPEVEPALFAYIGGICVGHGCSLRAAGAADDHVHLLISPGKEASMSSIMMHVKKDSSRWMNDRGGPQFAWQDGYRAFSIGMSQLATARAYLAKQRAHHRRVTFMEEFEDFLRRYEVDFDPTFLWT
ncbi:MAG: IS200/IS605 family transposase [Phycisphaerales bacterium]|nr:IS200/IS605 family transposase [Phycisphaerales bacterium]